MASDTETTAMLRALSLAAAPGLPTGPNPRVGCVLLGADGSVLASGVHRGAGTPHAEVDALSREADVARDARVSVVYADPGEDCYVSVSGKGRVLQDLQRQHALWGTLAQAWFSGGADDPDLRLLRVDISAAEYWDVDTNKMVQLLKMAEAAITGKPPIGVGEHREISM